MSLVHQNLCVLLKTKLVIAFGCFLFFYISKTGNWTVLFSAQDTESGLSIIDVDDHTISTVWTEDYSQGQVIRPINGKIR